MESPRFGAGSRACDTRGPHVSAGDDPARRLRRTAASASHRPERHEPEKTLKRREESSFHYLQVPSTLQQQPPKCSELARPRALEMPFECTCAAAPLSDASCEAQLCHPCCTIKHEICPARLTDSLITLQAVHPSSMTLPRGTWLEICRHSGSSLRVRVGALQESSHCLHRATVSTLRCRRTQV